MVKTSVPNINAPAKIKNISQEIIVIRFSSFGVDTRLEFLLMHLFNNMEDSKKTDTPIKPKIKYGIISIYDGSDFLVITIMTPGKPITAIIPPISLPSINGKCLISDNICCLMFPIFVLHKIGYSMNLPVFTY